MKIAIIGAGISGLTAARQLDQEHELTIFEANDYLGGHTPVSYTHLDVYKRQGCLTARRTGRAGAKAGLSDPVVPYGRAIAHRIKGTPGITG